MGPGCDPRPHVEDRAAADAYCGKCYEPLGPMPAEVDVPALIAEAQANLLEVAGEANVLAATGADMSAALVPASGSNDAVAIRSSLAHLRTEVVKKQAEVQAAQARMKALVEYQMARAMEALEPLQKQVAMLTEGLWTINLYLGREEEIVTLASGDPAPADEPLTIRQQVLYMDEECRIAAEDGGIDARSIGEFDQWLLADPAHLAQVCPEPKAVVVLKPRRSRKAYEDPWMQKAMDEANAETYWLLRNGDNLYSMTTNFNIGERVIGTEAEFTSLFNERRYNFQTREDETVPLEPGSHSWMKAEEAADGKTRHYMRVGMILQGLVDRTTVFHPLPEGGISLLGHDAYASGKVRLITNEERVLTTGMEPFYEWQRRLMAKVTPGMRIVGAFNAWHPDREEQRITPRYAPKPESLVPHTVDRIEQGDLIVLYKRTDKIGSHDWRGRWVETEPQKRASVRIDPGDRHVLPFDLVDVPTMQAYLDARTERHAYMDMVPLLKAAIAAKQAEHEAEEPFRAMLLSALVLQAGLDSDEATAELDTLVTWWKHGNRVHRALTGDPEGEAKAVRMIVKEAKRRATANRSGKEDQAVAGLRLMHPNALAILRKADGTYVIYDPQPRAHPVVPTKVFVTVHERRGDKHTVKEWVTVSPAVGRWRSMYESPEWADWNIKARAHEHATDAQIADLIEAGKAAVAEDEDLTLYGAVIVPGQSYTWAANEKQPHVVTVGVNLTRPAEPTMLYSERMPAVGKTHFTSGHIVERTSRRVYTGGRHSTSIHNTPLYGYGNDAVVLYIEPGMEAALAKEVEERGAINKRGEPMRQHAAAAAAAWQRAWHDAWVARVRARFDEDYTDPDLWEGHLKLQKEPRYPKGWSDLGVVCGRLIERGHEIDGLTGAEIVDAYLRHVGPTIPTNRVSMFRDEERLVVDDSLLDLVVKVLPEDEPEPEYDDVEDVAEDTDEDDDKVTLLDSEGNEIFGVNMSDTLAK